MVKLFCGLNGTGKTKGLIEMSNNDVLDKRGDIVFIDADNSHILDLNHEVRLINAMEFDTNSIGKFHGFLCGIIAGNYDIQKIYIDGLYKILKLKHEDITELIRKLEDLAKKYDIEFILSLNCDPSKVNEDLKEYLIA